MIFRPTKISELAQVMSGGGAPQYAEAFSSDGNPFVRAGSLIKLLSGANELTLEKIKPKVAQECGLKLFPEGTVLFAKSGMSATKGYIYRLKRPSYVVNHLAALVPREKADSRFLVRALQKYSPTSLIKDSAYPSIRLGDIEAFEIKAPSCANERGRIAEILDVADDLRIKQRNALDKFETLVRSIFIQMFGDPITNPMKWPVQPISRFGKVITGNTPPRSNSSFYGGELEWIKSDNLNNAQYIATIAEERLSDKGRHVARIAPKDSILVTCIAGSPSCIGNAAMLDREAAFNQQINAIIPGSANPLFLYAQILVGKRLIQNASSAGMKGIVSKSRFEELLLIYPPISLQDDFARHFYTIMKTKQALNASLSVFDSLFASLQDRAFRGEL
jgi:type I restriction enzyme, S subunit